VIGRIISLLLGFLGAIVLITLALANRHSVTLKLDPFNPGQPVLDMHGQFFLFLFAALIAGVVLGGMATWFSQAKWRFTARTRTQEAMRWKAEAERLSRERDETVIAAKQLSTIGQ